ncbi:hypothetical protein AAHB60_12635 [Pseudomonas aeruginosa]
MNSSAQRLTSRLRSPLTLEVIEDGEDQRPLEDVVVEGAEQLGDEERQETPLAQQGELRMLGHRPCYLAWPPKGSPSSIGLHGPRISHSVPMEIPRPS